MKFLKIAMFLFSIGFLSLLYAYFIERENVEITHLTISSPKFAKDFNGFRIIHISDLHIDAITPYEEKIARLVNAAQPDVIVITGDFFKHRDVLEQGNRAALAGHIDQIEAFLNMLSAPDGIYMCRGNNDFSNDVEVSDEFLERMYAVGVVPLVNSFARLPQDGAQIYLLGVDFPGFSKWDVTEFINKQDAGRCLESGFSFKNSYSHVLLGNQRDEWRDYTYTGQFRQSHPEQGGLGFTFYSQFDNGYDRFYRLRRLAGWSKFVLSPHGAGDHAGLTEFEFKMDAERWYRFKIQCRGDDDGTRIKACVWAADEPEPETWQADAIDTTSQFQNGTVGIWSHAKGTHQFDDLCVVAANGDTLFFDDFEDGDTFAWVDFNFEGKALSWLQQAVPDSAFSILLGHSPDLLRWADAAKIDLLLSGHTHGGQVQAPLWGPILSASKMGRKYAEGLFQFDHTTLYVNRGIGTVLLPIRFLCRPEITVIDLAAD